MKPTPSSGAPDTIVEEADELRRSRHQSRRPDLVPRSLYRGHQGLGALRRYHGIADRTVQVILESDLFDPPTSGNSWPWMDPDYFFHFRKLGGGHHAFFRGVLGTPDAVSPDVFWHLFWALTEASQRFVSQYIQFWSHEERLTGHLTTELVHAARGSTELFDASMLRGRVALYYADVAARSMEAKTGADFALIVHVAMGDGRESFKVARFQAKKVGPSGKARIDLAQLNVLRQSDRLGYYVFYYPADERRLLLPPTVAAASSISLPPDLDPKQKSISWEARKTRDCCDLAAFIVFALADVGSEHGVTAASAQDAARTALHGGARGEYLLPSRAVILSVGAVAPQDWYTLLGGTEAFGVPNEAE